MASDEEPQRGAIENVEDFRRADVGEMMEDDSEGRQATQRIKLVKTAHGGVLKSIDVARHNH
jgi:hypothetical protein